MTKVRTCKLSSISFDYAWSNESTTTCSLYWTTTRHFYHDIPFSQQLCFIRFFDVPLWQSIELDYIRTSDTSDFNRRLSRIFICAPISSVVFTNKFTQSANIPRFRNVHLKFITIFHLATAGLIRFAFLIREVKLYKPIVVKLLGKGF